MIEEYANYFRENKYVVIKNFINRDTTLLLYEYMKSKANRESLKYAYEPHLHNDRWDGEWVDPQSDNTYSKYGDPVFDSLLNLSNTNIENCTGLKLLPQYSYWRLYETGNILEKHKDRESCEISLTICMGYDISNLEDKYYNWPIYVENKPIYLNPGDILIYRGCEVEHWRDEYKGLNHAQVFLHYNDANGPHNQIYDNRLSLGLPKEMEIQNGNKAGKR